MSNVQNLNKEFSRIVKSIRKFMPYIAVFLLLGVYGVAAWAEGFFLAQLMPANVALAYCIGIAVQLTRGTLVFFPQLNPTRPTLSLRGEIIAIVMGLVSVGSIIGLVVSTGLAVPVAVSLSILMLAGVGVELFLLKEIKFSTHMELFQNKSWWVEIQDYHLAEKKLGMFLDKLRDATDEDLEGWEPVQQSIPQPSGASTPLPSPSRSALPPAGGPRTATLDDVKKLMEETLRSFRPGGQDVNIPPASPTNSSSSGARIAGMKLSDIYKEVKDQGVTMMDLADMSLDELAELMGKAGKLPPAPKAEPTTSSIDTTQRDRYLRAAKANIRAGMSWESENYHTEAKLDYDMADDFIRQAYPGIDDKEVNQIHHDLVQQIHRDMDIQQNGGDPLDLTQSSVNGKKSPPRFGLGNGMFQ